MSTFWFVLAGLALLGAVMLMYLDRARPEPAKHSRSEWAAIRGLDYTPAMDSLEGRWKRGVFDEVEDGHAVEVAGGLYEGSQLYLFDLRFADVVETPGGKQSEQVETITILALQRPIGSAVVFDLRSETSPAPREDEVNILGAVGRFFAFSDDLDVARRVCDRRMVAFAEAAPEVIEVLWSEGDWSFCWLAETASANDWDDAIAALARFSSLLRVLPPDRPRTAPTPAVHDPGHP
ncbi:hypothetical protein [Tomitella biformata]|uniref:hypothetical protein n=1 Tax=Tomitella biformata TaxID=630403 RepID=UPI00057203E6|nr:hypothetical protein [Tomitella biformata]